MQKGAAIPLILVGILIVAGLVSVVFYLGRSTTNHPTPSPSPVISPAAYIPSSTERQKAAPSPSQETTGWKTYTNTINNYQVKYPPNLVVTNGLNSGEVKDSALFDYPDPKFGLPQYYISVIADPTASSRDINIYNSLSQPTINKIFALKVSDELDQQTTYDIGGEWNFPSKYKRLTDEIINGKTFLVLENPKWYGGSDRRLFIRENRKIYMIGKTYNGEEQLQVFKKFYLSFKFLE